MRDELWLEMFKWYDVQHDVVKGVRVPHMLKATALLRLWQMGDRL